MEIKLQERNFLLLRNDSYSQFAKDILEPVLDLTIKLIINLNEKNFSSLVNNLDTIKKFAAGINRANSLKDYKIANFYPTFFAFHQFFHSSYRARQGKVLEKTLQKILRDFTSCGDVPEKVSKMRQILKEAFAYGKDIKLDIDALGKNEDNKKIILIQIRSRDDTGGTTAKSSLVDFLKEILRTGKTTKYELLYLIGIWDKRDSQQRKSTILKIYSSLKELINEIDEANFEKRINDGILIRENIKLKLAYGIDEIAKAIYDWDQLNNDEILEAIQHIIKKITSWDDLWVSYSVSSLELELFSFNGISNIDLLNKYLKENNIDLSKIEVNQIDKLALFLASKWREETVPFSSLADKILYIRDLVYLRKIYLSLL